MDKNKNNKEKELDIKIILLGESGVGKTNLINVYFEKEFNQDEFSTVTNTQLYKIVQINDIKLNVTIWDTIGQEQYRSLTKTFIRGSNIIIFVYDITRRDTFLELNYWVNNVNEEIDKEAIFGLVANKVDLFDINEVEKEEGAEYAQAINALFCEASAKENPKSFKNLVNRLLEKYLLENNIISEINNEKSFNLKAKKKKTEKKNCCS